MKTIKSLQVLFQRSTWKTVSLYTSCACYYILLSLFPALMFSLWLLGALSVSRISIRTFLEGVIPEALARSVEGIISAAEQSFSFPLFSVSVLLWLWSASKGISAITDGMYAVLRLPRSASFFRRRATAIAHFALVSLALVGTALLQIFGTSLLKAVSHWIPVIPAFFLALLQHRTVSSFLLLSVVFTLTYKLHPGVSLPFRFCLLGAMLSACGWVLFSLGFSFYIDHFANQYHLLGDIGALLLLSIWLRYCIVVMLYGVKYASIRAAGFRSAFSYVKGLLHNILHE